jgi:pyrrolidone-carboxylate peptidase
VYQLNIEKDFSEAIGEQIWTFPYRYRDSYESTTAFILQSDGLVFLLLGAFAGIEMITLDQIAILDEDDEDDIEEDEEIDFSFM